MWELCKVLDWETQDFPKEVVSKMGRKLNFSPKLYENAEIWFHLGRERESAPPPSGSANVQQ